MGHGGKREAGPGKKLGRPSIDRIKAPYSMKIDAELRDYLRDCENGTAVIESALRRSKGFQEWKRAR